MFSIIRVQKELQKAKVIKVTKFISSSKRVKKKKKKKTSIKGSFSLLVALALQFVSAQRSAVVINVATH